MGLDYVRTISECGEKCWISLEIQLSFIVNFMTLGIKLNKVKVVKKLCYRLKAWCF